MRSGLNPLDRGSLIQTRNMKNQRYRKIGCLNPLDRGSLIQTRRYVYSGAYYVYVCLNPLDRGSLIQTVCL